MLKLNFTHLIMLDSFPFQFGVKFVDCIGSLSHFFVGFRPDSVEICSELGQLVLIFRWGVIVICSSEFLFRTNMECLSGKYIKIAAIGFCIDNDSETTLVLKKGILSRVTKMRSTRYSHRPNLQSQLPLVQRSGFLCECVVVALKLLPGLILILVLLLQRLS